MAKKTTGNGPQKDSELAAPVAGTVIHYQALALRETGGGSLIASGDAPTSGFVFFFSAVTDPTYGPSPLIAPTRFEFRMRRPDGIVAQVVTPFRAVEPLSTVIGGSKITVTDAAGAHTVIVTDTSDPVG